MARTKGAKGSVGSTAKENVIAVFTRLGGTAEMAKWARANQTDFYKLYARLIPQQIDLEVSERPKDLTNEPLKQVEWDERYSATLPN